MQLPRILSNVVTPVVDDLLRGESVQEICIYSDQQADSEINLRIVVAGETFHFYVKAPGQVRESEEDLRHRLAQDFQDFISESSFGWGQLRPHNF